MTNQELQIKLAEAMGWSNLQLGNVYGGDDLDGQGIYGEPFSNYQLERWSAAGGNLADRLLCEGKLIGTPPSSGGFMPVPNWPNDLPACMQDLWPWLAEQVRPWGGSVVLEIILAPPQSYGEGAIGYCCAAYTYPDDPMGDGISEKGGEAICHAVLAVKEKLTE